MCLKSIGVTAVGIWSLVAVVARAQTPSGDLSSGVHEPQTLEQGLRAMRQGYGLTAEQVVQRALASSPDIEAKRQGVLAAQATVEQTRASFYPQLTGTARYTRVSPLTPPILGGSNGGGMVVTPTATPEPRPILAGEQLLAVPAPSITFPVYLDNWFLQGTLSVPLSDYVLRLSNAVTAASRSREAAVLDEQATLLAIARDARISYYQWVRAQSAQLVATQALEQARGHYQDARNAFEAGLISKADVLRAESAVKSTELFLERARNAVALGTERLRVLMHDESNHSYGVGEDILAPVTPISGLTDPEKARAEALQNRLEIRVLAANAAVLREQAGVIRVGNLPRLDAQANLTHANPNPRFFPADGKFHTTWDASLILTWTPSGIFGNEASARGSEAKVAELYARERQLRDGVRLEIEQALASHKEANFALGSTAQALTAAEEGYRVRRELFRSGRATMVELTDAETELTRARLELVDAHVNLRIARVQLWHVLGRDTSTKKAH